MTDRIDITIVGIPAPQGSKTRMPNGAMVEGSSKTGRQKLVDWRARVRDEAAKIAGVRGTVDDPVALTIEFRFPPTKSDPHRVLHQTKPDLSKILRATEDALVAGGLLRDDALVQHVTMAKFYAGPGQAPGCDVSIELLGTVAAVARQQRKIDAVEANRLARATA